MKNELDRRVDAVLYAAAKAGDAEARRAWRVRNGFSEVPNPWLTVPSSPSWYFDRNAGWECEGAGDETWFGAAGNDAGLTARASGTDARNSGRWGYVAALEEAFANGRTTRGELTSEPLFVDGNPSRTKAFHAAHEALEDAKARLMAAAANGGDRKALEPRRAWVSRRDGALRRLSRP